MYELLTPGPNLPMPIFLDAHLSSDLPLDAMREFLESARQGTPDVHGVRALDLYCGDDGTVYYLVAAPSDEAVRCHHRERGLACEHLRQVNLFGSSTDELSDDHKALVRHMIVGEQALRISTGGLSRSETWLRRVM